MYCKNVSHQYYATNQDTKPHILSWNCPKIGLDQCLSFFICHSFFYYAAFFPLKGKLKYIIIRLPYEISNDIKQSYQFSRRILPLLPLNASNIDWQYSVLLDLRHSIIEVNESNTQDVNRAFPNLIPTETLVFSLYLSKFANSLFTYLRVEIFVIINCCIINYRGTYFCGFGPKSQTFDPQITVLDKGFKANRKKEFRISSKNFYFFWVTDFIY